MWRALGKALKPGVAKEILTIDRDMIRGNISYSPETWHSGRVESVESLEGESGTPEARSPRVPINR